MSASILDGKALAARIKNELKTQIAAQVASGLCAPGLAVILLGSDHASRIYVQNKRSACAEVGIRSYSYDLPVETSQDELVQLITTLNHSTDVDGILLQLPLPSHINQQLILETIAPHKDVDGFHPYNMGRLIQKNPLLRPCTPKGIIHLMEHYELDLYGKHAVILGASIIVGRPMSMELLLKGASVSICHRATTNLQSLVESADLLILATGVIDVIDSSWLKSHQVVIDVGINRLSDGRIRGDVDFNKAQAKVAWITPVPGGVGPMTIASLLENTVAAAALR